MVSGRDYGIKTVWTVPWLVQFEGKRSKHKASTYSNGRSLANSEIVDGNHGSSISYTRGLLTDVEQVLAGIGNSRMGRMQTGRNGPV